MSAIFISICIPAYKRTEFLKRLLDSIVIQRFRDFEVIVSDDSPAENVKDLCDQYKEVFNLRYHKNSFALGTPENWNAAIRNAKGEWIKIMHDDDWFSHADSLGKFAEAAAKVNNQAFIFSSYTNMYFPGLKEKKVSPSRFRLRWAKKDPVTLLSSNVIGPPSVTMHKRDADAWYDKEVKWLVDIDFYVKRLAKERLYHIPEPLIHVGMSDEQVTAVCHTNPDVEIPENYYFIQKVGVRCLRNIMIYDAWWRLLRNFGIKTMDQLEQYTLGKKWPQSISYILKDVNKVPSKWIKIGVISKLAMTLSYFKNKRSLS